MTPLGTDETSWAAGVGSRLKVLQASFADDPPATRRDYLKEELDRALRDVPVNRRRAYLVALTERFPAAEPSAPTGPVALAKAAAKPENLTLGDLVTRLTGMAGTLSPDAKLALARQLAQVGIVAGGGNAEAARVPVPAELQKRLGLSADQTLDNERVTELIAALVDMVVTLDHLSWSLWRQLAPKSIVKHEGGEDLRKLAGPYLTGNKNVNIRNLTPVLNKTRQLIGGLLGAIGSTGETFARNYLGRFSPEAIKEQADAEPGFFIGPEQKCWRKYCEMFQETSGMVVENEITGAIVKYTEELILGINHPGSGKSGT